MQGPVRSAWETGRGQRPARLPTHDQSHLATVPVHCLPYLNAPDADERDRTCSVVGRSSGTGRKQSAPTNVPHYPIYLSRSRDGIAARREELSQRGIDLLLVGDGDGNKLLVVDFVVSRHERAGGAIMTLANLAIAKDVAKFHQLVDQLHAAVVVPGQVIAIGKVERVNVPVARIVASPNDLQGQFISRGDLRAAALALVEELFLGNLFRLSMVADKDNLHVVVLGAQEPHHPEVETTRDVFLKLTH